jgi:SAM-dependent methyltransferase
LRIPSPSEFLGPSLYRRAARKAGRHLKRLFGGTPGEYEARLAREVSNYRECATVHELPQIFHYWSNRYLLPKFEPLGFRNPDEFFALHLRRASDGDPAPSFRYASIGAGNCDTEVRVAVLLRERGLGEFVIDCVDINPDMLERGREMAERAGVARHIRTLRGDFNKWVPDAEYDAVMANQSLHHVCELEHLFDSVAAAIGRRGLFVVSDMIGRNGHQRWPEALAIVREYWQELPDTYRFNQQLRRHEAQFLDWDCSQEGFEGIRAQDILPLLVERFSFDLFAPFANVIDPFIDRGFGHNFNAEAAWDREFIDRVHARDEVEMRRGTIKPTHMMGVMCLGRTGRECFVDGMTPAFSVRVP